MRCLTLAKALTKKGAECHFVCRKLNGNLISLIQQTGFHTFFLPEMINSEKEDATETLALLQENYQLLILDHYHLGMTYCQLMRQRCHKIMVIDDLANRMHDCDVLLDQNLLPDAESRYEKWVPNHCKQLLGPKFALLRDEFYQLHTSIEPNHILISFGGSDEQNLTALAIEAISNLKFSKITADIVLGMNNPWRFDIEQRCKKQANLTLHIQTDAMAPLMQKAQLMLGAGGATHWERCISGLPALVVIVAENQQATTEYLDKIGACICLGKTTDITVERLSKQLYKYLSEPKLLRNISQTAASIVPLNAGTPLVIEQIVAITED
ncbi:UDP-2,4-diacetamido-2,4,6-trideoxy-beta-L-altropyranose hydrolase [Alishewanella longhuensis]|uniref:UDP-2,4-diacetamido-2,4, 6-trideoxy-beta-L-altropyranose hydrolase n=2 Tax=Alishewanella longhuensis TaxID=1091037 RepID=A0ABQ3L0V2_9ALTE|nr:UDP-2,4-diacetamido-2,4,6-trideoxy-beta-L-altropyranose hydrolase [Alishewanella longhuensis]